MATRPEILGDAPIVTASAGAPSSLAPRTVVSGTWSDWWLTLWLVGTAVRLIRLAREGMSLARLGRRTRVIEGGPWFDAMREQRAHAPGRILVSLREGDDEVPVMSWGWRRPHIIVPRAAQQWDESHVHSVLFHEFAHIDRSDSLRFALMELVRAIYWWHPLVWMAVREARLQAECACDDTVLRHRVPATAYAAHLVHAARLTSLPRSSIAATTAYTSFLERRVTAMLTPSTDRSPVRLTARCLALGPLFVLSLLVASAFARPHADTGTLVVTVRPDGAQPLPDVEVVLTGGSTSEVRVRTDASGAGAVQLAPGAYRATVRVPGFKRYEATIDVGAGEHVVRDFALSLGALTERVSVAGETDPHATPIELRPDTPIVSQIGVVSIPRRIDDRKAPAYPSSLRDAGVQGTVKAAGRVGPDGHVSDVRIVESPHPELSDIVTRYVAGMRYEPTRVQGTPMATDLVVTIDFRPTP